MAGDYGYGSKSEFIAISFSQSVIVAQPVAKSQRFSQSVAQCFGLAQC